MKNLKLILFILIVFIVASCGYTEKVENKTAVLEQQRTEINQSRLNKIQPPPSVDWSLERDNLIKRFALQNDRSVTMYMYVFIEGVGSPIGYYIINKVSSVNSQLTNPSQIVQSKWRSANVASERDQQVVLPSPAEDGSYGTNGDGVFGFTPDGLYVEHNMKYIVSTAPLMFKNVPMIGQVDVKISTELKRKLNQIEEEVYGKK